MKKRTVISILVVAGLCLFAIVSVLVGYSGLNQIPDINSQIPEGFSPLHVKIDYPDNKTG